LLLGCGAATGINTDLVGPGKVENIGYADFSLRHTYNLSERWDFERTEHLFILYSKDTGLTPGVGVQGGLRVRIYNANISAYTRSGLCFIPDGGDVKGLAHSVIYGRIELGLTWKQWSLGLDHYSSPFHHAKDGDSGINFIKLEYRW
jgi:hypothetical protein